MTESLNIGGVSFQADQVKTHHEVTNTRVDDSGNVSAFTTYYVEMNDGTKLSYEAQPADRKASVFQETDRTKFFGLSNVEITDTPKDDIYMLYGCEFTSLSADRTEIRRGLSADSDHIIVEDRIMGDGKIQISRHNNFYLQPRTKSGTPGDYIKFQDDPYSQRVDRNYYSQSNERKASDIH